MNSYIAFLEKLDAKLDFYFKKYSKHIYCKKGCSLCCEKGDYPLSDIELKYLMQGYINLDNDSKIQIQKNIKEMKKGEKCPFLIEKECSVYPYRPIICRVHGLAYLNNDNLAKLPYCVNDKLNYSEVFNKKELLLEPIKENLDTQNLLNEFDYGEIKNLYDWINS